MKFLVDERPEANYEWINTSNPPEVDQDVLVYRGAHLGGLMQVMTYKGDNVWEDDYGYLCHGDEEGITYWMPLPEPPVVGKEKE